QGLYHQKLGAVWSALSRFWKIVTTIVTVFRATSGRRLSRAYSNSSKNPYKYTVVYLSDDAALGSRIGRAQSEADFDDDAGAEGEVSAESIGKTAFPGVGLAQDAKPVSP